MEEITRELYDYNRSGGKTLCIWYYNDADKMIYRKNDGEAAKPEMSYAALKSMAATAPSLQSLRMKCTRDLVRFVRNRERQGV